MSIQQSILRILKYTLLIIATVTLLTSRGSLNLSPTQQLAAPYLHSITQWELQNLPDKWVHRIKAYFLRQQRSDEDNITLVREYFDLVNASNTLDTDIRAMRSDGSSQQKISNKNLQRDQLTSTRLAIRDEVEEILESQIDSIITKHGLLSWGPKFIGLKFPPVDIRLGHSPRLLITSPRDRIEMIDSILIDHEISEDQMAIVEDSILDSYNMSALVEGTGGVATFPAVIASSSSLAWTVNIASHEWLHHYLFFQPLGKTYGTSPDMTSINETLCNMFGHEIGLEVYSHFYGNQNDNANITVKTNDHTSESSFDLRSVMHETRLNVDSLLSIGLIDEAEELMEETRQLLSQNGYHIRKINQAYFAFHGTYSDSPASTNTIYEQLQELRNASGSLSDFVNLIAGMSSYEELIDTLEYQLPD